jgi:4-amino-4-deoxy-L-arabinose transferase-like glycosyltransferase
MDYRRAFPLTWLAARSAEIVGERSEFAFRLPVALLGALSVPALFLLGRRPIGTAAALTAAVLMAFSEWHLVFSRQARMYAPLLLFMILGAWGLWSWARTGGWKPLLGGVLSALIATTLHKLGLLLAGVLLVWLLFPGALAISAPALLAVSGGIAAFGVWIHESWIDIPYGGLPIVARTGLAPLGGSSPTDWQFAWWELVLIAVGLVLAWRLYSRVREAIPADRWLRTVLLAFALASGVAAGAGQVYAFGLAGALFLILGRGGVSPIWHLARAPLLAILVLVSGRLLLGAVMSGPGRAIEVAAAFPYPHAYTLLRQSPAGTLLFGLTCVRLALFPVEADRRGLAAAAVLTIGMIAALGVARQAGPTRYLLPAYPFMLLVAGGGLYLGTERLTRLFATRVRRGAGWTSGVALAASIALVASGVVRGHGVAVAAGVVRLEHGTEVDERIHMFSFRPDHRTIGRYVRDRRGASDIVVAEDASMQGWYAGPVDYWFRRQEDMRRYLRQHPEGRQRDIYVGSVALPDGSTLDSITAAAPGRVWFLTSGETAPLPEWYLTEEQRTWLDSVRHSRLPLLVGEDGVSAVYCLNCRPGSTERARP